MPNYGSIGSSGISNSVKYNKNKNNVTYSKNNNKTSLPFETGMNRISSMQTNHAQTYYSSETNAPKSTNIEANEKLEEKSKTEKVLQWLNDNIFEPSNEVRTQNTEVDRQIAEQTAGTVTAVTVSAVEGMVDAFNGMMTTGAKLGEYTMLGAQQEVEMQLAEDAALGKISEEERQKQSAKYSQEYSEARQEMHDYAQNSAQRVENFKSKYIFDVQIPGTETTIREYIIEYSIIQEDSFAWQVGQSIGQMIPVIVSNTLIPGSGTAVFATSCFGNSLSAAYANGANEEEALIYAALTTTVEVAIELIPGNGFGGVNKIGKIADSDIYKIVKNISNNETVKKIVNSYFTQFVFNAASEGAEEIISDFAEPFILKASYLKEEDLNDLITESYTLENFATDFLLGAASSAGLQSLSTATSIVSNSKTRDKNITKKDLQETYDKVPDSVKEIIEKTDQRMLEDLNDSTKVSKDKINQSINEIAKTGGIISSIFKNKITTSKNNNQKAFKLTNYYKNANKQLKSFYKDCDSIGFISQKTGEELAKLVEDDNYIIGIHRAGEMPATAILESGGLLLTGHEGTKNKVDKISDLELNISFYEGKNTLFNIVSALKRSGGYKTSTGEADALIVRIPKNAKIEDLVETSNVTPKLKNDYIYGYVHVKQGDVGDIVHTINYDNYKKENFTFNNDDFEFILSKGLNDTLLGEKSGINKNSIINQGIYDVHNLLIDSNPHYKKAWDAISNNPHVKCHLETTLGGTHYSYNEAIRISPKTFLSQSYATYFHEVGHALLSSNIAHYAQVVYQFNKILNNNAETIKNRAKPLFEVAKRMHQTAYMMSYQVITLNGMDPTSNTTFNYQNQLTEGIERNSGFASVMDIYDAVTTGKTHDIENRWYGHGEQYYKRSFDQKFQEIFANFHALKCIDNTPTNDFCKSLIGNEMWDFLEKIYDEALNAKLTKYEANTTAALLNGGYKNNNVKLTSPTTVNMDTTISYKTKFDYIIQNMSQKYPNWLNYLKVYIDEKGNLNRITGYNDCRLVASSIPLNEFVQMYKNLNMDEILKAFSNDIMINNISLPNVVMQFLSLPGNAYSKLININTVQKSYPNKFEYDQFMNKYDQKNGYNISNQNGYFKHIRYGEISGGINHRLYINCEPTTTYKFLDYFADACKEKGLSFYFKTAYLYNETGKTNASALTRSESAVIYASSNDIIDYINICKQIKMEHPELSFYEPPIATGNIDGWLGYGKEPEGRTAQVARNEGIANSFNKIRSEMLERGIYDGIKSCIKKNMQVKYFNGQTISSLYANELYNSIINKYPSMIDAHKQILFNELNNNLDTYMNIICSSEKPCWQFKAQLNGRNSIDVLTVDMQTINESLKNFHFNYTVNDHVIYSFIRTSIKKYAKHFYIDENNLYLSE